MINSSPQKKIKYRKSFTLGNNNRNEFISKIQKINDQFQKIIQTENEEVKIKNMYYMLRDIKGNKKSQLYQDIFDSENNFDLVIKIIKKSKRSDIEKFILICFFNTLKAFMNKISLESSCDNVLSKFAELVSYYKQKGGNILFRYGDTADKYFLIIKGRVSVLVLKNKRFKLSLYKYFLHLLGLCIKKEIGLLRHTMKTNAEIYDIKMSDMVCLYKALLRLKIKKKGIFSKKSVICTSKQFGRNFGMSDNNLMRIHKKNSFINTLRNDNSNSDILFNEDLTIFEDYPSMRDIQKLKESLPISLFFLKKVDFYPIICYINKEVESYNTFKEKSKKGILTVKDYKDLSFDEHFFYEIKDKKEDKEIDIFSYFEVVQLKEGETFGDLSLTDSEDSYRTASILVQDDSIFVTLNSINYSLCMEAISKKIRKEHALFFMKQDLFSDYSYQYFYKEILNYFKLMNLNKNDIIMEQSKVCEDIFFIRKGQLELSCSISDYNLNLLLESFMKKKVKKVNLLI